MLRMVFSIAQSCAKLERAVAYHGALAKEMMVSHLSSILSGDTMVPIIE